ncbi:cupin [Capsulimonas corticalis]|uniref:Cupin n=1 Tax=Capsulimonas corticalis TaxID=2219043 RepID=A0A402D479_9BACT|nr:cupin domain-containing protein [Capsulimonas corticalis]BDI31158.1 cupin [Capsulimonas corticalis]
MASTLIETGAAARVPKLIELGAANTKNVFGVRVDILLTGDDTAGQFCSYECFVEPGDGPPPHVHSDDDETFYIAEGEFEVLVGDSVKTVRAGEIAHLPRGVAHTFKNIGAATGRLLGTATPAGHEHFFSDADQLTRSGNLTPQTAAEVCLRYGITLLG